MAVAQRCQTTRLADERSEVKHQRSARAFACSFLRFCSRQSSCAPFVSMFHTYAVLDCCLQFFAMPTGQARQKAQ